MASPTVDIAQPTPKSFFQLLTGHPLGFWFIFWGEFAERCSYYGMRAVLATYMASELGLGKASAGLYMSVFIGACYLLPLLGGYLADNFTGKYWIIVAFSIPYIAGHFILGIEDKMYLLIALALLAMGSGVIKPNISTLMGLTYDQRRPGQEQLRTQAFEIFYMSINIGAFISQLAIPHIKERYGYAWAFSFPAWLMVLAFLFFAAGKPFYAKETIVRKEKTPEERALQWQVLARLGGVFGLVMFFWAVFDQSASTWIFYAGTYMTPTISIFGYSFNPEQMQAINPFLIVCLLPLTSLMWNTLTNFGINVRATDKILVGFLLTAATMAVMAYCGFMTGQAELQPKRSVQGEIVRTDSGEPVMEEVFPAERRVSLWWQALAYLFLTIAEILISVTGLELAFVAAPKTMKSFVTSLWLFTVFLANWLINIPMSQLYPHMHPGAYFAMLVAIMLVVSVVFVFVARPFNQSLARYKMAEEPALEAAAIQGAPGAGPLPVSGDASTGIQSAHLREGTQRSET